VKGMQVLNLIREFEMQRMNEWETIKDYSDRLLDIVNKVRLLGTEFTDSRIVQKILVTVSEKFEATISSIENSKDVDTTKRLMSSPKCRSVEVINNPARPGSNHREVYCINYS
jgi:hypothetical protein